MDIFKIVTGDKILLVGEGNFSFSVAFIEQDILENSEINQPTEVIASCFQPDKKLSELAKCNVDHLREKGITVLFNVDATKLKNCSFIANRKFTKIIFNFPHVGGKMKIHLNRKLLADFFVSSRDVLAEDGTILLTLCDGQGGTDADKRKRRWDDTWKVVEMAAEADFLLKNVYTFNSDNFPGYRSTGFRSMEVGFHTENAITHMFKFTNPVAFMNYNDEEIQSLFTSETVTSSFGTESVKKSYAQKILNNPLNDENTFLSYLCKQITNFPFCRNVMVLADLKLLYGFSCKYLTSKDLFEDKYPIISCNNYNISIYKGVRISKWSGDFSHHPISCELLYVGRGSLQFAIKVVKELLVLYNFSASCIDEQNEICGNTKKYCLDGCRKFTVIEADSFIRYDNNCIEEMCSIHLDNLAMFLLRLSSWHQLWANGSRIDLKDGKVMLLTPCIFPCMFTFDISISTDEKFSEEEFFDVLWTVAGNMIFSVTLISSYEPLEKDCKNFCYRLEYKSYEIPLFRKRVIDIHQNLIGKALEKMLDIKVL